MYISASVLQQAVWLKFLYFRGPWWQVEITKHHSRSIKLLNVVTEIGKMLINLRKRSLVDRWHNLATDDVAAIVARE
ncbi:MAG: hypothetical protein IPL92_15635 [Saprospiraceae bacterium]|nr:hypothetical protein [Candidatus Opimibacter iunctus]